MKQLKKEEIIQLIIGIISLAIFLWGFIHEYRQAPSDDSKETYFFILTTALSIYILILSDRITSFYSTQRSLDELKRVIPQDIKVFFQFNDSKEALDHIAGKMRTATLIKNTMIQKKDEDLNPNYRSNFDKKFIKSLQKNKNLECIEVYSKGHRNKVKERKKASNNSYHAYYINDIPTVFINYSIIKFNNGEKELILGWATNVTYQNQEAFLIKDSRAVDYFEHVFDNMMEKGKTR